LAQSPVFLNSPLGGAYLAAIARTKQQYDSFDRLRLRLQDLPAIEFAYHRNLIQDARITNYYKSDKFNTVSLTEFSLGVADWVNATPYADAYWRVGYRYAQRSGLVDFDPSRRDYVNRTGEERLPGEGEWWEGTAHIVAALNWLGRSKEAATLLTAIQAAQLDESSVAPGAIPAASVPELSTGFVGEDCEHQSVKRPPYSNQPHIGATAWYVLAALQQNPYHLRGPLYAP
jgi:hypothetical protein